MISVEIVGDGINAKRIRKMVKQASKDATKGIARYAINQIPTAFTITSTVARKKSNIRAISNTVDAELIAKGTRLPLIMFKHNPTNNTTRKDRVTAEIRNGEVTDKYPAFIRKRQIFERIGENRYPIRVKRGSSVPEMISETTVKRSILREMLRLYKQSLERGMK